MSDKLIKAETLKGFRDYLPTAMMAREQLMETARRVYRSYGFSPIDTPALEYTEVLLGKGGGESDKQLFRFTDQGGRDVSMRFDLTVPFARFAAQHLNEIGTPFKRYHIGTVWRGERPQKGRYREFVQCDFDTIGTDSNTSDIETLFVINDLLEAIGFSKFTIRVNHRFVLNGLLEQLGLGDKSGAVLRALDKLPKIGPEKVLAEMGEAHIPADSGQKVLEFAAIEGTPEHILSQVEGMVSQSDKGLQGIARLGELFQACQKCGLPEGRVALDLSIARGLDYYTGTIYETFLSEMPGIGSVCSGGRYDNLAGLFTRESLPGVGASLGLDRLLAAMEELGLLATTSTPVPVLVTMFDAERGSDYLKLARILRQAGIGVEVYPAARPLKKQLQYADRKGFRLAIIAGSDEFAAGTWTIKDLKQGTQTSSSSADLIDTITRSLS